MLTCSAMKVRSLGPMFSDWIQGLGGVGYEPGSLWPPQKSSVFQWHRNVSPWKKKSV